MNWIDHEKVESKQGLQITILFELLNSKYIRFYNKYHSSNHGSQTLFLRKMLLNALQYMQKKICCVFMRLLESTCKADLIRN